MKAFLTTLALLVCAAAPAQDMKPETVKYILALQDPATGGFKVTPAGKPSLRACNGGVKSLKAMGQTVPDLDKIKAFVTSCYDAKTGTFAEPGGKPDVAINAVGLMIALDLGLPREKFAGAMTYLKDHADTFEEMRIAAAAVEAWGVGDCPFSLDGWLKTANDIAAPVDARTAGSVLAMCLRLGKPCPNGVAHVAAITGGQNADGGWGVKDAAGSDLETCYRVVRALKLARADGRTATAELARIKTFAAKCKNADGGYGVKPGEASSMSGTYYAVVIDKFLGELAK